MIDDKTVGDNVGDVTLGASELGFKVEGVTVGDLNDGSTVGR